MTDKNKNVIVIYKSKCNDTKKYATWIAEKLKGKVYESTHVKIDDFTNYDIIVYGGALNAVGIKGAKLSTKNFKNANEKKKIILAFGCSTLKEEEIKEDNEGYTDEIKDIVSLLCIKGTFTSKDLDGRDKMMMRLLRMQLRREAQKYKLGENTEIVREYNKSIKWTKDNEVIPIV